MPTLEILVGMVGSGKSTYARSRARQGALVICHDDLTEMLHAEYRYEPELKAVYRKMEEQLAFTALKAGKDVIIDRTHLTRESRQRWVGFRDGCRANDRDFPEVLLVAVVFPLEPPEVHAERRFASDARGRSFDEWLFVARHHHEQATAEPISFQEVGFDCVCEDSDRPIRRAEYRSAEIMEKLTAPRRFTFNGD